MKKHAPAISVVRARSMRRNATDAERRMWALLREHSGFARCRRQVPLRQYICDFASHSHKLVIEIDGGQHSAQADASRSAAIEAEGYRIARFWNSEVLGNPAGCAIRLAQLLPQPHPQPGCAGGQARKLRHPSPIKGEGR